MPTYTCEKCSKEFTKKTDYSRHLARKISCVDKPIEQIIEEKVKEQVEEAVKKATGGKKVLSKKHIKQEEDETDDIETKSDSTSVVMNLVNNLHNIMRNKDAITGQKAFHDIIRLLMLRFMEPMLEPNKKLANMLDAVHYSAINEFEPENVKLLNFTTLMENLDDDEFAYNIYLVWGMLSVNKLTENIFSKNKGFHCKPSTLLLCCLQIQKTLKDSHFDEMDNDIKGQIYEAFVNGYAEKQGAGKEFGQFFTPRKLINLIFKLNKEIFPDQANPESIYDPCTGTGGFLTEMFKHHKLNPENIYGGELEPDTYATGLMNLLLTTGSLCNITNGDSLANNDIKQFDWIATNPPFGMKGIKHKTVLENLTYKKKVIPRGTKKQAIKPNCFTGTEMYPVVTNDGSALFLQHCITRLKYGGVCNIVLPDGQLFTGKTFMKLRKYLVDECALKAVLNVPSGTFEHTGVQTAVLFFTKFEDLRTDEIAFYQVNADCTDVVKLGVVDYDQLEAKSYVLSWNTYKPKEERKVLDSTWEIKKLGEICTFLPTTKHCTSMGNSTGIYRFYNSSDNENKLLYLDTYSIDKESVIIGNGGNININIDEKFTPSKHVTVIQPIDETVLPKYLYYYLLGNKNMLSDISKGVTIKWINKTNLAELEISIPSLEKQKEIIAKCEEFKSQIEESEATITQLEKTKKLLADAYITPLFTTGETKTLGEVCALRQGEYVKKDNKVAGEFDIYGGGNKSGTINRSNAENCIIVAKDGISIDCVRYVEGKFFLNHHAWEVKPLECVSQDYLKYFLQSIQAQIFALATGSAQKGINQESFNGISIPVPAMETQLAVVKKFRNIDENINVINDMIGEIHKKKNDYMKQLFNEA